MNNKTEEMSELVEVRKVYPEAYAEQVGTDSVQILVCIGETPNGVTTSITEAAWKDALARLSSLPPSGPTPPPCNFQTYAGEGNIDFCPLPLGHDDGTHEDGITNGEIEAKWAELNADDGDIRIMAMLHELLQRRRVSPSGAASESEKKETFPEFWNGFGLRMVAAGDSFETIARTAWHAAMAQHPQKEKL